jgi:hypothetical protein
MTNNRDDRNINLDYTKKNAKDRAALDLAEQEAVRMHGSIIGNKLKARAQKIWGNQRKTGRIKPVVTAAAKSESKMDALQKKKWP